MADIVFSWRAETPAPPQKTAPWYWTVGILGVGGATSALISENILFAILILICAFTIMLAGSRSARTQTYGISERGVHVGSELVSFSSIEHFSLEETEPRTLILETNKILGPVSIPLGNADFRRIRSELKNRGIEETEPVPSLSDALARLIGM